MSTASSVRPSRTGWWISAILFAAAVACAIIAVTGFSSFKNQVNGFQRVSVPGHAVATFTGTGSYVLYTEGPNKNSGTVDVLLRSKNGGPLIRPVQLTGDSTTYTVSGHSGESAGSFTIPAAGQYTVVATSPSAGPHPSVVALGRGGLAGTFFRSAGLIVAAVVLFFLGLLAVLITALRHRRTRRMTAPAQGAPVSSGSRR